MPCRLTSTAPDFGYALMAAYKYGETMQVEKVVLIASYAFHDTAPTWCIMPRPSHCTNMIAEALSICPNSAADLQAVGELALTRRVLDDRHHAVVVEAVTSDALQRTNRIPDTAEARACLLAHREVQHHAYKHTLRENLMMVGIHP